MTVRIVEAESVQDYLSQYYKKSRTTETLLNSYEEEFAEFGCICTSHYDNVVGEFIAWPFYPTKEGDKK